MTLLEKITERKAHIGIIGLGYIGLPLVIEFCKAGFPVTGLDVDDKKVRLLQKGRSYIKHIDSAHIKACKARFRPTSDFSNLKKMDCIILCVPTPLNRNREPDMSFVFSTARVIAMHIKKNQLILLESTTYPGTTSGDMKAILEEGGLRAGRDFCLAYSPEREDPNNKDYSTRTIPKIIGGYTKYCLKAATALYDSIVSRTVPVSSTKVAEATKLLENIYRAVNIALVNEMKVLFDRMDIDIWEVIEAASTKPFGFQAFYPGPGLGGHCIPIDPFYLTWKAREYDMNTKFIELAGEVNATMPYYVVQKVVDVMNKKNRSIKGARILMLGLSYKKDVDDIRESPSLKLIELLKERGARVDYNDPYIPCTPEVRRYNYSMRSVSLTDKNLKQYDCVVIATDHSVYDYDFIVRNAPLVVDTRNATNGLGKNGKIIKA